MTRTRSRLARTVAVALTVVAAALGLGVAGSPSAGAAGTSGLVAVADAGRVVASAGDDGWTNADYQEAARVARRRGHEVPGRPMAWFGIVALLGIFIGIPMWLLRDRG